MGLINIDDEYASDIIKVIPVLSDLWIFRGGRYQGNQCQAGS